jgi:hypothetical protein
MPGTQSKTPSRAYYCVIDGGLGSVVRSACRSVRIQKTVEKISRVVGVDYRRSRAEYAYVSACNESILAALCVRSEECVSCDGAAASRR